MYMVTNDQGLCLIRTTDSEIAKFVNQHSKGVDPKLRLTVGGDPGSKDKNPPIWKHVRRLSRH
jgi:hypothetical protein